MADFFIRRPIVAMVIAILTVLAGLVAMLGLPIAQFPDIVPPLIQINATYTGADAITIEQSVATPLEQQMNGVDNMLYMKSINANDGTMQLQVTFDIDTLVDMDQVNAQNRVSQASPNLPTDVNQYGVTVNKSFGLPLLVFSVYSPKGTYDGLFLSNYITINMKDVIYRTKGVGQVTIFGAADYALRIWVKPDKLAKLGLTVNDLMTAVKQQSNVNPAGKVGGEPAPAGHLHDLHGAGPGPPRGPGAVRADRRPPQPRRLHGPAQGRGPPRAGRAQLQPGGERPGQARGRHRRLPGPRLQRPGRGRSRSRPPWRSSRSASPRTSTTSWRSTRPCRSWRASTRS